MIYKTIGKKERELLENSIFNGYKYARKRSAYQARSNFYSQFDKLKWMEMVNFFGGLCCKCECEVIGGIPTKDHIIGVYWGARITLEIFNPYVGSVIYQNSTIQIIGFCFVLKIKWNFL